MLESCHVGHPADHHLPEEHLLVGGGSAAQTVVALSGAVTHVGRGVSADLHLDDHTVSRRHALLVRTPEGTRLIDDRSANGTWLNGVRVRDVVLCDGDVISLGRATLTYCLTPRLGSSAPDAGPLGA